MYTVWTGDFIVASGLTAQQAQALMENLKVLYGDYQVFMERD